MVSPNKIKTLILVELAQFPKYLAVGLFYVLESAIFPEFIPVTGFNVGKLLVIIVIKRMKKDPFIMSKIISPTSVSPVTITEDYVFI